MDAKNWLSTIEQNLFDLVEQFSNTEGTKFDVINVSDEVEEAQQIKKLRVYHREGYCFEVCKGPVYDDKGAICNWEYGFLTHWDGFDNNFTEQEAINLLKL